MLFVTAGSGLRRRNLASGALQSNSNSFGQILHAWLCLQEKGIPTDIVDHIDIAPHVTVRCVRRQGVVTVKVMRHGQLPRKSIKQQKTWK
jgi:hypothetical protein